MEDMQKRMAEILTGQQNEIEELKNNFGIPYKGSEDVEKIDQLRDKIVGVDLASGPDMVSIGGHAVTIVGEDENGLKAVDSWNGDEFTIDVDPLSSLIKNSAEHMYAKTSAPAQIMDPLFDPLRAMKLSKEARKRKERNKMAKQSRKKNRK